MKRVRQRLLGLTVLSVAAFAACSAEGPTDDTTDTQDGGGSSSGGSTSSSSGGRVDAGSDPTYLVGGSVRGLAGTGLTLQLNVGGESLVIAKPVSPPAPDGGVDSGIVDAGSNDGSAADAGPSGPSLPFRFTNPLKAGTAYAVSVKTQPTDVTQTCSVSNASGTVGMSDISNIQVVCSTNAYAVGGSVTGLAAGASLTLQNNGADDLVLSSATVGFPRFTFASKVASGSLYSVKASKLPNAPYQACSVAQGSGTITNADVTNVAVTCKDAYQVSGTVQGIGAGSLVLQNNNGDDITLTEADTTFPNFAFPSRVGTGDPYAVTIKTMPAGRNCVVSAGSGTMGAADVSNVSVTCTCASQPRILLLGEGSEETNRFEAALLAKGAQVSKVAQATTYANVPRAIDHDAVLVLVGNFFDTEMAAAGQTGIVAAHNAGRGLVYSEWGAYQVNQGRWQTLAPTLIGQRTGGNNQTIAFTVDPGMAAHPVWAGLPASFTTVSSMGVSPLALINGGVRLANCPSCDQAAVVVKDAAAGKGRIVQSGIAPGWQSGTINGDVNTTRLYTNAAQWAANCR